MQTINIYLETPRWLWHSHVPSVLGVQDRLFIHEFLAWFFLHVHPAHNSHCLLYLLPFAVWRWLLIEIAKNEKETITRQWLKNYIWITTWSAELRIYTVHCTLASIWNSWAIIAAQRCLSIRIHRGDWIAMNIVIMTAGHSRSSI